MPSANFERRRAPRAAVSIPIRLSPHGTTQPATLVDLSSTGLCCRFGEAMTEMTLVAIDLQLPGVDALLRAQGAVVRCDKVRGVNPPTYEIGIYFTDLTQDGRAAILDFVSGQLTA